MAEPQLEIDKKVDRLERAVRRLAEILNLREIENILDGKEETPDVTTR